MGRNQLNAEERYKLQHWLVTKAKVGFEGLNNAEEISTRASTELGFIVPTTSTRANAMIVHVKLPRSHTNGTNMQVMKFSCVCGRKYNVVIEEE